MYEVQDGDKEDIRRLQLPEVPVHNCFSPFSLKIICTNEPSKTFEELVDSLKKVQKFHFVGGLDCPDWILAEMASLSKLPVLKFKNWCSSCVECLVNSRTEWNDEQLTILNTDKTFDDESLKRMLAALTFILEKTTKNACSARDLEIEMQQTLQAVDKDLLDEFERIKKCFVIKFPRASPLMISSVHAKERGTDKVYIMNMHTNNHEDISIMLNDAKLNYLMQELSQAMDIIRPFVQNTTSDTSDTH
ncbi:Comm domain-containing protein 4 [Dirofilaria immitis]|nr:Comm domain-containing protein 4 [Dirofilaria immitis]